VNLPIFIACFIFPFQSNPDQYMANQSLSIGSRVRHPIYGAGIVLDNSMESAYTVVFKHHGEKAIAKDYEELEIIELAPLPEGRISLGDLERVLNQVLDDRAGIGRLAPLHKRFEGGTLIMKPADESLKSKEVPIETFFHKIVMVRDRLRVLEQNVNKSKNLSDQEKVNLQQYITRIYGSLTTFNVLFQNKEDSFKGEGGG
jgi:hypothetical protein